MPVSENWVTVPIPPASDWLPQGVDAPPSPPPPAALPPPPRRRRAGVLRWIAPVRVWQLATWQVAALAVAFTLDRPVPVRLAVAAAAGAVFVLTSVRTGGRCLSQWADTLVRYRRRRGARRGAAEPLTALLPDLRLRQHVDRAGNRVGLAVCGDGLTAVVRLTPTTRADPGTLLAVLRDAFDSSTIPLAAAQLVVWTVAAPRQGGRHQAAAAPEPMRVYWLALRYRPGRAPDAARARGGGETGAMRATASAALGLVVRLDEAGYPSAVLDQDALGQELLVALGASATTAAHVREGWRSWSATDIRQVCYLPDRRLDPADLLDRWIPEAAFTCVSYTLTRTARGQVHGESAARLGTPRARGARPPKPNSAFGGPATPTTGRHHRYVLRTLPLATDL
jgi:type VII secretion protein EccE